MKQQFYAGMPWVDLAMFAFVVFGLIFVVAFWRAWRKPKNELDALAALPLSPEETP